MKFVVDTARVAQFKKLAVSGLLDECRKLAQPDKELSSTTGPRPARRSTDPERAHG